MATMTREQRLAYQRAWRKKHPHYSRNWSRRDRGQRVDGANRPAGFPKSVEILGIRVMPNVLDY